MVAGVVLLREDGVVVAVRRTATPRYPRSGRRPDVRPARGHGRRPAGDRAWGARSAGSGSARQVWLTLRLLGPGDEVEHSGEDLGEIRNRPAPDAVGHRVEHGGTRFTDPVLIDAALRAELEELTALAEVGGDDPPRPGPLRDLPRAPGVGQAVKP